MNDIVKLYNPANAAALTEDEIQNLQKLTSSEIKILAQAYPNVTMQRAYLLIIDSKKQILKQLPTLSSFENLWNLREKNGKREYVAYGFKGYKQKIVPLNRPIKREVVDLSDVELMTLPGFKTANSEIKPEVVQVKKIKKIKDNA